jgi:hypothetical protein
MTDVTRIVVRIVRIETATYMLEGRYDEQGAIAAIESGEYGPFDSDIHTEYVGDVLSMEWRDL